jgi:putative pyruvate formate lyase activating enzyme
VGPLQVDEVGLAFRGLLVRHLGMPERYSTTAVILQFVASLDPNIVVNVMDQYRPCYRVHEVPQIARAVGLRRLDRG